KTILWTSMTPYTLTRNSPTGSLMPLAHKTPSPRPAFSVSAGARHAISKKQTDPRNGGLSCLRDVTQNPTPDILNEKEAAAYLRLAVSTLEAWRMLKRGPRFAKLGRRVVYRKVDLEKFLEAQMVEPRDRRKRRRV